MTNVKYFELVENSFTGARSILQLNNNNVRELAKRRDTPAWTSIFMFDGEDLLSHIENSNQLARVRVCVSLGERFQPITYGLI